MRMPEAGPLGETFLDASSRAMVRAFLLKSPDWGCVESVVTARTQRCGVAVRVRDLLREVDFFADEFA